MRPVENDAAEKAERHNVGQSVQITLSANGEILKALVDSIYSNKEKTVVRELMANAFDSHVKAGCPERAIEVHIPTSLDPTFVVRDYGVGMSHDFIMRNYAQLGDSTKRNSNEETGQFGVGSKSPMSISDTFTIKAYDENQVRLYVVDRSGKDLEIHHTITAEGSYERGVEIIVPVDPTHRSKLLEGLSTQHFAWFDKPVKFLGAYDEVKHRVYKTIREISPGLFLAKTFEHSYGGWSAFVRQGASVYPLDQKLFSENTDNGIFQEAYEFFRKRNVLIDIPIGTADITISRESIQYNPTSTANLIEAICDKYTAFKLELYKALGDAETYKDAFERLYLAWEENPISPMPLNAYIDYKEYQQVVADIVIANAREAHAKLPHISVMEEVWDEKADEYVHKPTMRAPIFNAPEMSTRVAYKEFPEGKLAVALATLRGNTGNVSASWSSTTTARTSYHNTAFSVNIYQPVVVFLLPTATVEWQTRITDALTDALGKYFNGEVPHAFQIMAIRVPRMHLDEARNVLKKRFAHVMLFDETALAQPSAEAKKREQRTYSKTTAYAYNFLTHSFSNDKTEPAYDKEAYYVIRRAQSDELHGAMTNAPADKSLLESKINTSAFARVTRAVEAIDPNFFKGKPLYRVTERQADRLERDAPLWKHFPTAAVELAHESFKEFAAKGYSTINSETLLLDLPHALTKILPHIKTKNSPTPLAIELANMILADDYLLYSLAMRWYKETHVFTSPNQESVFTIVDCLEKTSKLELKTLEGKYDELVNIAQGRYGFMLVSDYSNKISPANIKHYLYGLHADTKVPKTIALGQYPTVDTYASDLRKHLQMITATNTTLPNVA